MRLPLFLFSLLTLTGLFVSGQTANNNNSFPAASSANPAYLGSSTIATPLHKLYTGGSIKSFNTGNSGFSSPSLYLANTTASTGRTYFINSNSAGLLRFVDSNANADRLVINSSGNVGIGVAPDATYRLKINGFFLASSGGAYFGNSAGNLVLNNWGGYINNQASSFSYLGQVNGTSTGEFSGTSTEVSLKAITNVPLSFYTNNTEKFRVAATGNVLVGTTTDAGYKLDVNGSVRALTSFSIKDASGNTGTITQNQLTTAFGNQTTSIGSGYRFYTMLDNSVGSARLYVGGAVQDNIYLSTSPQTGVAEIGHTKGGTAYEAVINLNDGKVGIGTNTPSTLFSVANQFKVDANGITSVNTSTTSGVMNLKLMGTSADRPYGIYLNSGGSAGGANGSQYGIYGDFLTSNNGDEKLYGVYFDVKQNLSKYAYGVVGKATTVYNEAIGIDGHAMQAEVGGPGMAIGVRGIATSAGSGTLGTTYAGYFDNQAVAGNKNYGVYIKTSGSGTYGIYQEGAAKNYLSGNLHIGTTLTPPGYKLAVGGNIIAEKVRVSLQAGWPDYVFDKKYKLPTLREIEQFIQQHQHLPGVPSAAEVEKEGIDLGDNQAVLLKKIEELTLHLIELSKKVDQLKEENKIMKRQLQDK